MTARDIAKRIAFRLLGTESAAARRLAQAGAAGRAIVLNLHRVAPDDGSTYRPLAPELFRELLRFVTRHADIVNFAELPEHRGGRPAVVLSFDDGYRDFVDYAAPIMDEFGVTANLNVIPAVAESGLPPLNVVVQDLLGTPLGGKFRDLFMDVAGIDLSRPPVEVSAALKDRPMAEQQRIAGEAMPLILAEPGFRPTPMMTVEEVRQVARRHEIGAHSYHHANMDRETDAYFTHDLAECRDWFERVIGATPRIYAFPNGACRDSQVRLAEKAGYTSVLLVGNRFTEPGAAVHPRFNFDAGSLAEMRYRAAGERTPIRRAAH